jgi:DNA-directed RNA polymerase specialized sigma24 family protein
MTILDHQLYAWLSEPDERRFERAFSAYFSVAFPAVVRRLARLSRWDSALLEELAQDALLRFFDKVGRRRREAADAVRTAVERIRPLNLGPFHERQVKVWIGEVAAFRAEAMRFRLGPVDEVNNAEWKGAIRALGGRIPPLQQQGCHLLKAVQLELGGSLEVETCSTAALAAHPPDLASAGDIEVDDPTNISISIAEPFARQMMAGTTQALAAEEQYPGVILFVQGVYTVIAVIPQLRVPTNGYLFQIAMTIYLDECKRRGRRKRGGQGIHEADASEPLGKEELTLPNPVEVFTLDSGPELDAEDFDRSPSLPANGSSPAGFAVRANDPTRQYEDEEFLEKFYEYLQKPVDEAAAAYRKAQLTGSGSAERRRLESLTKKLTRMISVLSMLGEGYTQEGTAERLGLTRNQVKYIIELVQEAYERFATASSSSLPRSANVEGQSHAS